VKKILFTKSPAEYYERGLALDKWRFNGVTPKAGHGERRPKG
jgi:tetrathionate reductase subunit A